MKRSHLLIFALLIALCAVSVQQAQACGGGMVYTVDGFIALSDHLVRATPVELDDLAQNVVLRVDEYLTGGIGSRYILLRRINPVEVTQVLEGRYSCSQIQPPLSHNQELYLFISRRYDGSYAVMPYSGIYHFASAETTFGFYVERRVASTPEQAQDSSFYGANIQSNPTELTEPEFRALIAEYSGETPTAPDETSPYPLHAALRTTAENGDQYLIPIDGGELQIIGEVDWETQNIAWQVLMEDRMYYEGFAESGTCATPNCRQISPDGLQIAVQTDENTITLIYGQEISGQAALFSPTSEGLAVWNGDELLFYTLGYPRVGHVNQWQTEIFNRIEADQAYAGRAAWSPDGRQLAFSTAAGLWLWDVYSVDSEPRLILASEGDNVPVARYFSPMGRYLAIEQEAIRETLDLMSGERYPDGVISPDDRILLAYDTAAESIEPVSCSLTPFHCSDYVVTTLFLPFENGDVYPLRDIRTTIWIDRYTILIFACDIDVNPGECATGVIRINGNRWTQNLITSDGEAYDYDHANDALVTLDNGTDVYIGGELYLTLPEPAVSIEWLPSLFYREG